MSSSYRYSGSRDRSSSNYRRTASGWGKLYVLAQATTPVFSYLKRRKGLFETNLRKDLPFKDEQLRNKSNNMFSRG